MPETKRCRDCGIEKPQSEFYQQPMMRDGLLSYCKPCQNARTKARYHAMKPAAERECIICGEVKSVRTDFYHSDREECKECTAARNDPASFTYAR